MNFEKKMTQGITMVYSSLLTHWGRATYIYVSKLTIIGLDNGLLFDRRQAIIWANAGILLFEPLGTKFSEFISEIYTFSLKKMCLKMLYPKCRPFYLGLNVLNLNYLSLQYSFQMLYNVRWQYDIFLAYITAE